MDYVIVTKPYDGGPKVFGPYTLAAATILLQQAHLQFGGEFKPTTGYWSDLPSWWPNDELAVMIRRMSEFDASDFV